MGFFDRFKKKTVPTIGLYTEQTRDGLHKSFIPKFFYRPPFGYPRHQNITELRRLAKSPYVSMVINTIINEVASVEWDIVPEDGYGVKGVDDQGEDKENYKGFVPQEHIEHPRRFFKNPNTNDQSFRDIFVRMALRDMWEIGSGTVVKVFNQKNQLVELVARDAATFTKNPDFHGMYTDREGVLGKRANIVEDGNPQNPWTDISSMEARNKAAYFQYGWLSGPMPIPFGRREVVWLELNKRTDDIYPRSPLENLRNTLWTLIYSIESDLEYYTKNNTSKGIIGLEGATNEDIQAFKEQWQQQLYGKDELGNLKRERHQVPIMNVTPKFERMEFSSQEMEVIEKQKWYSKLVWSEFGVTPTELGFTEDAKGSANQIIQSRVFRKKAVNPSLRQIEDRINREILPEFGYEHIRFRFKTFDVDEKQKEAEYNKLLIESGQKTANEVRQEDGRMPVEWGDLPPSQWQNAEQDQQGQEQNQTKSVEGKPFAGYNNFDECVNKNSDKEDPEAYCAEIMRTAEGKAVDTDEPLAPKRGEEPAYLSKKIKDALKEDIEKIKELLEKEMQGVNMLRNIKGPNEIANNVDNYIDANQLQEIVREHIKNSFLDSFSNQQRTLGTQAQPNKDMIDFLSNYTFSNIKDMTEEMANNIRAELQRGIINGEGVGRLKERISNVYDSMEHRAETIARTENKQASNLGKMNAVKQSTPDAKKYIKIVRDKRTTRVSEKMAEKYGSKDKAIPIDEDFIVKVDGKEYRGQAPPFMPNDRDEVVFTFPGVDE